MESGVEKRQNLNGWGHVVKGQPSLTCKDQRGSASCDRQKARGEIAAERKWKMALVGAAERVQGHAPLHTERHYPSTKYKNILNRIYQCLKYL